MNNIPVISKESPMIAPRSNLDNPAVNGTTTDIQQYGDKNKTTGQILIVNVNEEQDKFYLEHTIDGRVIFPATGYLCLVWKALAKKRNTSHEELPVVFDNVKFRRPTYLPKDGIFKFFINILEGSGDFEIFVNNNIVASGRITTPENIEKEFSPEFDIKPPNADLLPLTKKDVYKELRLRGYEYQGIFQGITEADNFGCIGKLNWENNWVSFIDTIMQFFIIKKEHRALYIPVHLGKVIIDPKKHLKMASVTEDSKLPVIDDKYTNVTKSGGIEVQFIKTVLAHRRQVEKPPCLEQYKFITYSEKEIEAEETVVRILTDIVVENNNGYKLEVLEVYDESSLNIEPLASKIIDVIDGQPLLHVDYTIASKSIVSMPSRSSIEKRGVTFLDKDLSTSTCDPIYQFVIATYVINKSDVLANIAAIVKNGGFVLLREAVKPVQNPFQKEGLVLVATRVTSEKTFLLYRKVEISNSYKVINITHENYNWVEDVKTTLLDSVENGTKILLVAEGLINGIQGLVNCLKHEKGGDTFRSIFVTDKSLPAFNLEESVYQGQMRKDLLSNVVQNGRWGSFRHLPFNYGQDLNFLNVEHAYVNTLTRGDLSSLKWIESDLKYYSPERHPGRELCEVDYAPLNDRDILAATGKLSTDTIPENLASMESVLGLEFSGRNESGKRVMGIVTAKGLATTVLADRDLLWEVPESWTLKEASTIPMAYSTAYYALIMRGRMRKGESVLIHRGSDAISQAAISIALHMGCTVYTTIDSTEKKEFLKIRYPQLTDINFAIFHDSSFEQHFMRITKGKGFDVILNSLPAKKLDASFGCLAQHGRFLEIGKNDLSKNESLGMAVFLKNVTFHGVQLHSIFDANKEEKQELVKLITDGIKSGAVTPLPVTIFSENQLEEVFRFMAAGKHIGKVVLQIREEENQMTSHIPKTVPAISRTYFDSEKVYIIIGGLGGFGLELTKWMVNRGATKLVLVSRTGIRDGYQEFCVRFWKDHGINVVISKTDVTNLEGAKKLLEESREIGVVGGIFNLAMVLRDRYMKNQSIGNFEQVSAPKVDGTLNLDTVSRMFCPDLDYFVVFSSISCGRGNPGQANYGFANSVMERIVEERQSQSYPGLAIQFGSIGDVGIVQEIMGSNDIVVLGTRPQRIASCLETLDMFLQQPWPTVASHVLAKNI